MPCNISLMIPANSSPVFPFAEKHSSGSDPFLHISECSLAVNKFIRFRSDAGDDIRIILQKVTHFTESGFLISADISKCFHYISIDPALFKYFCLGVLCFSLVCLRGDSKAQVHHEIFFIEYFMM